MRRVVTTALTVAVVCMPLTACSDEGVAGPGEPSNNSSGPATTSTSSESATTPAETTAASTSGTITTTSAPTGPAEPQAPVLPAVAKEKSRAGAKAFVHYYIDVLNFAWHTLSPESLAALSTYQCRVCRTIERTIVVARDEGGYQHGGDWTPTNAYVLPGTDAEMTELLVTIAIADGTWRRTSSDDEDKIVAATVTNQFALKWLGGAWQVKDVRAT